MTDHEKLQIEMAASGCISGTLAEWPHLAAALQSCGHNHTLDTHTLAIKDRCRALNGRGQMMPMEESMSEAKHTPGPWRKYGLTILGADGIVVAELPPGPIERHANGRLIIAAPDLLAACKEALHWLDCESRGQEACIEQLRAAIAKASDSVTVNN